MSTVLIMAKEPVAGRVKTRLTPALTPSEAAEVAAAAIADTLTAAMSSGADRVVVALDGRPGPWLPSDVIVVSQVDGSLGVRLAAAWSTITGPAVQVGMDTPQITADDLDGALAALGGHDAALGMAVDGGWWALALQRPHSAAFVGVPMSDATTGAAQRHRLQALGLSVADLAVHRDIDHVDDLLAVAASAPATRTAGVAVRLGLVVGSVSAGRRPGPPGASGRWDRSNEDLDQSGAPTRRAVAVVR